MSKELQTLKNELTELEAKKSEASTKQRKLSKDS